MEENTSPPEQIPECQSQLKPHRGALILTLGIASVVFAVFSLVCCSLLGLVPCVCGTIAWVMGNRDLREMAAGTMDPAGQGTTKAGKICGIVGLVLGILGLVLAIAMIVIFIIMNYVSTGQTHLAQIGFSP